MSGYQPAATREASRGGRGAAAPARLAAAEVTEAVTARDEPGARQLLALAELVGGDADAAISILAGAAGHATAAPELWNDTGVAYFARFERTGNPIDAIRALDGIRRAAQLDPAWPVARFNLVLALARLNLRWSARLHADVYEAAEPDTAWAGELSARRAGLPDDALVRWSARLPQCDAAAGSGDEIMLDRCVREFPHLARERLDDVVLDQWLAGARAGDVDARTRAEQHASRWASALVSVKGDQEPADIVASIRGPEIGRDLLDGLAEYRVGIRAYRGGSPTRALPHLQIARARLARTASPYRLWAAFYAEAAVANAGDADSQGVHNTLAAVAADRGYPNLAGRVAWARAIWWSNTGAATTALRGYREAVGFFARAMEPENRVSANALAAMTLRHVGDRFEAWRHLFDAFDHLPEASPARQERVLIEAAETAVEEGCPWAALAFTEELKEVARRRGASLGLSTASLNLADALLRVGRGDWAARELESADAAIRAVEDDYYRQLLDARRLSAQAELAARAGADGAESLLSQTIEFYERIGLTGELPGLLLRRGELHVQAGATSAAETDFDRGIELFERLREGVDTGLRRVSYLDRSWDLYARRVALLLDAGGRGDEAFALAERARAPELARAVGGAIPARPSLDDIARRLPNGVRLFYYVVLNNRVALWVAGAGRWQRIDLPGTTGELERTIDAAHEAITRRSSSDTGPLLERLYAILVEPAASWVTTARALVVAPDGALQRVPFAALRPPGRSSYLIERVPLVIVPKASLLMPPLRAYRQLAAGPLELFVAGNPALADGSARGLPPLAGAEAEAIELARFYGRARAVTGASATRKAFLDGLVGADVVHVAAHALLNPHQPQLSRLLFAPDVDAGAVSADDVRALSLTRPRLLVLAACATAAGPIARGEGSLGLARAFLAAGLPAVVATQWPIDDRASRRLFVEFHRQWASGRPVADALRDAQLSMIGDGSGDYADPVFWAPVMAFVRTLEAGLGPTLPTHTQGGLPP